MVELSKGVAVLVEKIFVETDRQTVSELLRREIADNLPFMGGIQEPLRFDRLRMAALRLSEGDVQQLHNSVDLGKRDWRDLLMTAGFDQLNAHVEWHQSLR